MTAAHNISDKDDSEFDLENLIRPIGNNGVGEDPRYSENYEAVKSEIDRLSDYDYVAVINKCRVILVSEAKDLRIAGYYLLAMVFCHGLNGLEHGVDCFKKLLHEYGNEIHPQRESAKQQSINWLNNDRLIAYVNNIEIVRDIQKKQITRIKIKIDELNGLLTSIYGNEISLWTSLNQWLTKNQKQENRGHNDEDNEKVINITGSHANDLITSELSFNRTSESLLDYLEKSGDWVRKISISRALKWSSLQMPFNEQLITKISVPRPEILLAVKNRQITNDVEETLSRYESYFMEPGCQYYFDLQKREVDEAKKNNRIDIVEVIEDQLQILMKHNPNVIKLSYSDGTPFADESTRNWLNHLDKDQDDEPVASKSETEIQTHINEILYNAVDVGLSEQIGLLERIDPANEMERCLIALAKIDACIASGRDDLALPLANHLNHIVDKHKLGEWDETLAVKIWSKLIQIILSKNNHTERELTCVAELKEKVCATNMQFAVNRM